MKTASKTLSRWAYGLLAIVIVVMLLRAIFPDFFAGLSDGLTGHVH